MLEIKNTDTVIFIVENKKIACQKNILMQYDYFKAMLSAKFFETEKSEIVIKDVSFERFEQMIEFIKNGSIELSFNNLSDLLNIADQFLIIPLKKKCIDFINIKAEAQKKSQDTVYDMFQGFQLYQYNKNLQNQFHYQNQSNQYNKSNKIQNISTKKQLELIEILTRINKASVEIIFELMQTNDESKKSFSDSEIISYLKETIKHNYKDAFTALLQKFCDQNIKQSRNEFNFHNQDNFLNLSVDYDIKRCLLEIAIESNRPEMILTLLNENDEMLCRKLFKKDAAGKLPIHYAIEYSSIKQSQLLINNGTLDKFAYDNLFFDNNKNTPFDLACNKGKKDFVFNIIKYTVDNRALLCPQLLPNLLFWAAKREYYDIVEYLVKEKNVNVNQHSESGDSFLHWAARKNRVEAVKFLIQHKIEVNHQNRENRTALHEAAAGGHFQVTKILLQSGCKASFWDKSGKTALQLAEIEVENRKQYTQKNEPYEKTVELLEKSECKMQ